jgi:hypothetical protein
MISLAVVILPAAGLSREVEGMGGTSHPCFAGALSREAGAPPQNQRARPHFRGRRRKGISMSSEPPSPDGLRRAMA